MLVVADRAVLMRLCQLRVPTILETQIQHSRASEPPFRTNKRRIKKNSIATKDRLEDSQPKTLTRSEAPKTI